MTVEYAEIYSVEEALDFILEKLVEEGRRSGLRASKGGILQGIGFHMDTPYLLAEGLLKRGIIFRVKDKYALTETGEKLVDYVVRTTILIKPYSLFPELDSGKLLGAVLYAFYDWTNTKSAEEILAVAEKTYRLIQEIKSRSIEAFKLIAVTLPRLYFEDGKYTPLTLIEKVASMTG